MKILYVVSSLSASGPTNQLYNIINNLDSDIYTATVITLSPESKDSRLDDFELLNIDIKSLNLSRLAGLLLSKFKLKNLIKGIQPDLIHTQGIRADSLLASLKSSIPWVMTSRNFPSEDYPSKFGKLKGGLMEKQHFLAMRKCGNVVSCSESIRKQLGSVGIQSLAIQNGVKSIKGDGSLLPFVDKLKKPVFVTVGSLIPRKNVQYLLDAIKQVDNNQQGSLLVVGDGFQKQELESRSGHNIHYVGNVSNVQDYLAASDYFISSSLSEGLPNTVLEALVAGLPVILSNIPSHAEIEKESKGSCILFSLDEKMQLIDILNNPKRYFSDNANEDALRLGEDVFSDKSMSLKYQNLYKELTV